MFDVGFALDVFSGVDFGVLVVLIGGFDGRGFEIYCERLAFDLWFRSRTTSRPSIVQEIVFDGFKF